MGITLGANYKMVLNVILLNKLEEICGLRKPLEASGGLTSRVNKRYVSSRVTSK